AAPPPRLLRSPLPRDPRGCTGGGGAVNAAILSIGDELVLGQVAERNAGWLSARLADEGIAVIEHRAVADDLGAIIEALDALARRCDVVISTGGLGPTDDDLLRAALARVLGGGELVED